MWKKDVYSLLCWNTRLVGDGLLWRCVIHESVWSGQLISTAELYGRFGASGLLGRGKTVRLHQSNPDWFLFLKTVCDLNNFSWISCHVARQSKSTPVLASPATHTHFVPAGVWVETAVFLPASRINTPRGLSPPLALNVLSVVIHPAADVLRHFFM